MRLDLSTRDFPGPSIEKAIQLWRDHEMHRNGDVVEIGCMRIPLVHPIDEYHTECCLDGHSTVHFSRITEAYVTSVDISESHCEIASKSVKAHERISVVCGDGIKYLKRYGSWISFLFLDAWDADLPDTAGKHLEAFKAAEEDLTQKSIVLIDDTDVVFNHEKGYFEKSNGRQGKGELVIPYAESIGYRVMWDGRQTCMARGI
jgi:hypothetical protein